MKIENEIMAAKDQLGGGENRKKGEKKSEKSGGIGEISGVMAAITRIA
jgi:hypothetical protein